MSVSINQLSVSIPGQITRKYDTNTDSTTLTINWEQVTSLHGSLDKLLEFFGVKGLKVETITPEGETTEHNISGVGFLQDPNPANVLGQSLHPHGTGGQHHGPASEKKLVAVPTDITE